MKKNDKDALLVIVQKMFGQAKHIRSQGVDLKFLRRTIWTGFVEIFHLFDDPTGLCYAWSDDDETFVVSHGPPIASADDAVRAALMSKHVKVHRG